MRQHRLSFNPHTRQGIMAMIRSLQNFDSRLTSQSVLADYCQATENATEVSALSAKPEFSISSPQPAELCWLTVT